MSLCWCTCVCERLCQCVRERNRVQQNVLGVLSCLQLGSLTTNKSHFLLALSVTFLPSSRTTSLPARTYLIRDTTTRYEKGHDGKNYFLQNLCLWRDFSNIPMIRRYHMPFQRPDSSPVAQALSTISPAA